MNPGSNTETDNGKGIGLPPLGSDPDAARFAVLLGKDTRPGFKLKGIDGKEVKIPKLEETLYLMYLELGLIRRLLMQRVMQGRR